MIISEKQILALIKLLKIALDDNLSNYGRNQANKLLDLIEFQQSEQLKVVE